MGTSLVYGQRRAGTLYSGVLKKDDIKKVIGVNLRRLRTNRKLTQDQLGALLSPPVDGSHIGGIEGGNGLSDQTLAKLCNALEVGIWEFFLTDDAPVISNPLESEVLQLLREAGPLHVAEEFQRYGKFLVKEAREQSAKDHQIQMGRTRRPVQHQGKGK